MAGTDSSGRPELEAVVDIVEHLEDLAAQLGDDVVLRACDLWKASPERGFMSAIEAALAEVDPDPDQGEQLSMPVDVYGANLRYLKGHQR
jgi:hypothetical protein